MLNNTYYLVLQVTTMELNNQNKNIYKETRFKIKNIKKQIKIVKIKKVGLKLNFKEHRDKMIKINDTIINLNSKIEEEKVELEYSLSIWRRYIRNVNRHIKHIKNRLNNNV